MEITVQKPFLLWRDDWRLGFDCLDEQHIELVNTINQLHRFVAYKKNRHREGKDQISKQLSTLVDIARRHFKTEEVLMRAHGYPRLAEHHREHVLLLAELQECIREIDTANKPFTIGTLTALKHWQIDHGIYSDRLFADYMKCQSQSVDEDDFDAINGLRAQAG